MKSNKVHKSIHLFFTFLMTIIIISGIFCAYLLYHYYYRINWKDTVFTESSAPLSNPYRGWYTIYGYRLADNITYNADTILENIKTNTDTRLVLVQINLMDYRKSDLNSHALEQLETILSAWESTDKTLILRFLYDWDGLASKTEPDDIAVVQNHMSQVSTILDHHTSLIYTLQGIFVGNYGEMNHSRFMDKESVLLLSRHLADVMDPAIFLSVRTPALWRQITASETPPAAFGSRIGLFNDGMMGSENDCGTYGDSSDSSEHNEKKSRSDELAFQNKLCLYVPNGGEVIIDNPYNDLDAAIKDLNTMHVSYLNTMYDPEVLDKWKSSTYTGEGIFNGTSGYDFIGSHLGYRYVLRSTSVKFNTFRDKSATLTIALDNVGFANCYKQFDVTLLVENKNTKDSLTIPVHTDTRNWLAGQTTSLQIPLPIRNYETGTYDIYLSVRDRDSDSEILFANTGNHVSDGYFLGSISLDKKISMPNINILK